MEEISKYRPYLDKLLAWAGDYTPKLVGAVITLLIGFWLISKIEQLLTKAMSKRHIDVSLQSFLRTLVSISLKLLLIISVAGMIGFQTTSMVAVLGAAGLATGLALQGSLANFAGGMLLLIFKPIKAGEKVKIQDVTGIVSEIQIFNTILLVEDGVMAILPNGAVSNGNIFNYSRTGNLRIDIDVKVDFNEEYDKVSGLIMKTLEDNHRVLKQPEPEANIVRYDDGAMVIGVRAFTKAIDQEPVAAELYRDIQKTLVGNSIRAPSVTVARIVKS